MSKYLIVQPLGGLCNRMRVITGAAELAKRLNKKLIVLWVRDSALNAKFSDLFENIPYCVIDLRSRSFLQRLIWCLLTHVFKLYTLTDNWIQENARGLDFNKWENKVIGKNILIYSNLDIFLDGDYSIYKVKYSLLQELNCIKIDKNAIGLHIRRTDNEKSIKYSPTSLFLNKVKEEIINNPDVKFYLATDDPKEEQIFLDEFGSRILTYKKHSHDRNNPLAIKDAIIDLYNLSQCQKIYGSYWSSFSDTAALWTGIEKVELKLPI